MILIVAALSSCAGRPAQRSTDPWSQSYYQAEPQKKEDHAHRMTFLNTGLPIILWLVGLALACPNCDPFKIVR